MYVGKVGDYASSIQGIIVEQHGDGGGKPRLLLLR